jgi:hypothetical protein
MAKENGYWIRTEHGYVYVYQPETNGSRRSTREFYRAWMRNSVRLFIILAVMWTVYFFGPFPHCELWGFVIHP